ncbi:MAG: hypothetical protein PHD97_05170 [Bacteroidales bacterium]|nr:hypothetical protein [Bacteroidales bacterium]
MKKFILLFLAFSLFTGISFSQEEKQEITKSDKTEVINGKKYYIIKEKKDKRS